MAWLLTLFSRLPLNVLYGFGFVMYFTLYRVFGFRKQVVLTNLSNSFPQLDDAAVRGLAQRCYRNYAQVLMEMIKSITIERADLVRRVRFSNLDLIKSEIRRGQPVLVTVAHQCNIEWLLLALCCELEYPTEAIYRPIANPRAERIMAGAYTRFGGTLVDDRSVIRELMQRKDIPRVVAIASDQAPNINDQKLWTDFLHQETAFYLAPDTIARCVNYPVYFIAMQRVSRGRYQAELIPIAKPPYAGKDQAVVKKYIEQVEKQIRRHPEDWLWLHQRWKRKRSVYG